MRRQVLAMKGSGKTIREIAVALKVPKSTVARTVRFTSVPAPP
jgi:hypothetical protein